MKESRLAISGNGSLAGDKIFTCKVNVTVGAENEILQYDTTLYLKTFTVRSEIKTQDEEVKSQVYLYVQCLS